MLPKIDFMLGKFLSLMFSHLLYPLCAYANAIMERYLDFDMHNSTSLHLYGHKKYRFSLFCILFSMYLVPYNISLCQYLAVDQQVIQGEVAKQFLRLIYFPL